MRNIRRFPVMCWRTRSRESSFGELGVGRLTPMFIQEPFWNLTLSFPNARYIAVNDKYDFLLKQLEDKGMVIVADIARVLRDARAVAAEKGASSHA